jgi:hypothetical protein
MNQVQIQLCKRTELRRFLYYADYGKFLFFIPHQKKYGEAFHETLSSISISSLAELWANQDPVHPGIYGVCRDCCDPGEVELREKEKGLFNEFVRKDRDEQTRKKICCENIICSKKSF